MDIRDIILKEKNVPMTDVLGIVSLVCAATREQILASMDSEIDPSRIKRIEELINQRRNGKPLAYITNTREFYSHNFFVDQNVLVPRPETEILVEEALTIIQKTEHIDRILDMGTGSGIIGLTIALRTVKNVVCVDISEKALTVATKNARMLGLEERAEFLCSNLFDAIKSSTMFDMITANLPYVSDREWETLMIDVKDFEPRMALCGGAGGIEIYREFLKIAELHITHGGYILCEIGGYRQAQALRNLLETRGFDVRIRNDYSGIERIIIAQWKNL